MLGVLALLLLAPAVDRACVVEEMAQQYQLNSPDHHGWNPFIPEWQRSFITSSVCSIPRIHDLTSQKFAIEFRDKHPVIFSGAANDEFRRLTGRQSLLTVFRNSTIVLSTANTFSHAKYSSSFEDYLETHMSPQQLHQDAATVKYHFGDNIYHEWDVILDVYVRPKIHPETDAMGTLSFGLGGSGSGVNFHTHGAAYAEVLHGQKRWFLYPPGHQPNPILSDAMTSQQWAYEIYPELEPDNIPLECVCSPGEVLYIPPEWYHATLNIGESVFISTFT